MGKLNFPDIRETFENSPLNEPAFLYVMGAIFGLLLLATLLGQIMKWKIRDPEKTSTVKNINERIRAWWIMIVVFTVAVLTHGIGSILLFALTSILALREFKSLAHPSENDRRTWICLFVLIIPLNYYLLFIGWYGVFIILIPVYAFLFIPMLTLLKDNTEDFLERVSMMQWGLMICVYCVSHAPALLTLELAPPYKSMYLLLFLVTVVELNDIAQYIWGKSFGRHKIAPGVSPNKTVEGFVGGALTASVTGMILCAITPFSLFESFYVALGLAVIGFFGDLTMSAIKRSRDVKDFGAILQGHGGILDRIDSLCFAAPVFFHYVRYFYWFDGAVS
jgi:phosphatidate cytidylyltransferase